MSESRMTSRNAEYLLIETIRQVGVSNYSLIARLTGLSAETVRYKVNKQLGKMGLGILVNIDYAQLGFSMGMLVVKPNPNADKSWLDRASYLMLQSKGMGVEKYVCLYAIPYRFKKKYYDSITDLQKLGLIESFEFQEISWIRYPPMRSEFFDLDTGKWNVDWKRVDLTASEMGPTSHLVNQDAKVDYIDAKILKFMQEDPTISPAKIAQKLGANARTVRYHYAEHVQKGKLILGNNVRWIKGITPGKSPEIMQIAVVFRNLESEELNAVRKLCNKIPFTLIEASFETRGYFAFLDIPLEYFHETMSYIDRSTTYGPKKEITILDPTKTQFLNLSDELYDKERGWRLMPVQMTPTLADDKA
ncbi:MAG: winged helix-turn-helix domain-containing protein [Nitrososphaerales archaeon]